MQEEFKDGSVQVYSVQAAIPKDPAALVSAEYVQAEELFGQPLANENCLWDNRYNRNFQVLFGRFQQRNPFMAECSSPLCSHYFFCL